MADLLRVYRRLEGRGEIRGGRFVAGFSGEQFALPEAIAQLREARRMPPSGEWLSVSGADPLNFVGVVTPGPRLAALTGNRLLYRDGIPIALFAAGEVRFLETLDAPDEWQAHKALLRAAGPEMGGTKSLPLQPHGPLWVADRRSRSFKNRLNVRYPFAAANRDSRPSAAVIIVRKVTHVWQLGGALARSRLLHAMDEPRSIC